MKAFLSESDIHSRTVAEIFGVSEDQGSPEMRTLAKKINFEIMYGISPSEPAVKIGTSITIAKCYID